MGRKPTLEETQDLLRTRVISKIDIKEATLEETVAELNRLARSHGIPERELTFLIAPHLAKGLGSSPVIIRDYRVRNAPLAVLVKYLVGGTKLRFRVDPGRAIFRSQDDLDEEAVPVVNEEIGPDGDPFAEAGQEVRAEKKPVDPDDPFSQEDSE